MAVISWFNDPLITAGTGLAFVYVIFTTYSVLIGLNSTLAVLVAISYGQNDLRNCTILLQRGRLICFLAYIPLSFLAFLSHRFFKSIGVNPIVVDIAYEYALILQLVNFFASQFDCYR